MSVWTHVSGILRVDGLPAAGLMANLGKLLGTPSSRFYDDLGNERGSNIPGGSEGTLQYEVIHAGDGLVWKTVAIWGDLRDFGKGRCHEINKWFVGIVDQGKESNIPRSKLMLRSAHLMVETEDGLSYMLVAQQDHTVRRLDLVDGTLSPVE